MRSLVCIVACVVTNVVTLSRTVRGDAFIRIADTNSPVPGTTENFTALSRQPSLSGGGVLFSGQWSSASQGLFLYRNGAISDIADTTTQRPDGPGTFNTFNGYAFDGANAVFVAIHNGVGIYSYGLDDGILSTLGNQQTVVSSASGAVMGRLDNLYIPSASGGKVAVNGTALNVGQGIFTNVSGPLRAVVDQNTPAPGHPGDTLLTFDIPVLRGSKIAIQAAYGTSTLMPLQHGVYVADASTGALTRIADDTTQPPGGGTWQVGLEGFDGTNIALGAVVSSSGHVTSGIYTTIGGSLRDAVDTNTLIPGTTRPFGSIFESSLSGNRIAFVGSTGPGAIPGLFLWDDGTISQIVAPGGVLDGKTISDVALGDDALNGDKLVFEANFVDGSSGIYLTTVPEPACGILLMGGVVLLLRRSRISVNRH